VQEASIFTDAELHVHSVSVIFYSVVAGLGAAVASPLLRDMLSPRTFALTTVATQLGCLLILCMVRCDSRQIVPRPGSPYRYFVPSNLIWDVNEPASTFALQNRNAWCGRRPPLKRCKKLRIVDGRGFGWEVAHAPVSRFLPISPYTVVPRTGAARTTLGFGMCPSFKGHSLSPRAKP
jgi:hypothetical protein